MSTYTQTIATDLIRSAAGDIDTMGIGEFLEDRSIDDPDGSVVEEVDGLIRKATVLVGWPAIEPSAEPSADVTVLREAARQMRQRAEHATGENWNSDHGDLVYTVDTDEPVPTAVTLSAKRADVAHIAGWGPATAVAVADWLELEARMADQRSNSPEGHTFHALAVARAYLDSGWDGDPFPR